MQHDVSFYWILFCFTFAVPPSLTSLQPMSLQWLPFLGPLVSPPGCMCAQWLSHVWLCDLVVCPWDSLGKNTGMGCNFLLQLVLTCRMMGLELQGSQSHSEGVALPCSVSTGLLHFVGENLPLLLDWTVLQSPALHLALLRQASSVSHHSASWGQRTPLSRKNCHLF